MCAMNKNILDEEAQFAPRKRDDLEKLGHERYDALHKAKPAKAFQRSAEQILKLERRARDLHNMLTAVEERWNKHMDKVGGTKEWKRFCAERGVCHNYNFGDILA